ncbi:type II toxin-antitoxin system RelE/ParE family toxin [Rhizobium ruizarguesonis]|jgi:toxin ParE1/3/4|uniref:type II toxin-antitoxin system RelE/ParE family toxin n=1 Tax=Rhizobium ruizarguesonis TaxID=2081791 RepID=UPI001CF0E36E|nr:type II toxin-antitoxin system RelE/ParE family toxin [Rhizobium ruizarguesonis]MCB2402013.1 type II toxin-antitoxin system RelE/ParE family toxin [Rhizobium ruizarguesonis]
MADLTAKIAWIAEVDFTGSPRDHIAEGLRGLPYGNRCIYYRSYHDRIVVLRVKPVPKISSRRILNSRPEGFR